jgi:hypothetical protein
MGRKTFAPVSVHWNRPVLRCLQLQIVQDCRICNVRGMFFFTSTSVPVETSSDMGGFTTPGPSTLLVLSI